MSDTCCTLAFLHDGMHACTCCAAGVAWPAPQQLGPSIMYALPGLAGGMMDTNIVALATLAGNVTTEAKSAYISQPEATLEQVGTAELHDY